MAPKTLTLHFSCPPEQLFLAPEVATAVKFLPTRITASCALVWGAWVRYRNGDTHWHPRIVQFVTRVRVERCNLYSSRITFRGMSKEIYLSPFERRISLLLAHYISMSSNELHISLFFKNYISPPSRKILNTQFSIGQKRRDLLFANKAEIYMYKFRKIFRKIHLSNRLEN